MNPLQVQLSLHGFEGRTRETKLFWEVRSVCNSSQNHPQDNALFTDIHWLMVFNMCEVTNNCLDVCSYMVALSCSLEVVLSIAMLNMKLMEMISGQPPCFILLT